MSTPSFSAGDMLGRYRLVEKIGGGGQGLVFRAHDERFGRDVALKILPPKLLSDEAARKRFRQEARAVGKLNHPNIATAYDFDETPVDFLVTEYVPGSGLDQKLAHGALSEETVIALGLQLASGLEAAHHEGIIHRDLKPGNLRITESGQLKILDFGLAELVDPGADIASAETVTLTMTLTGTLPYMAPEQFEGINDQRTDLWAAGVVLYELATRQLPFPETQLQSLKNAIKREDPIRPTAINPAISPGLECVILRALQKDPRRRYQTAKELHDDLSRVASGRGVRTSEGLRGRGFAVALLAVILGGSALIAHHFWPEIQEKLGRRPAVSSSFRVLAVLPIDAGSQDAAENALVRGVAETISARLAQGTNGRVLQLIPPSELSAQRVTTAEAARKAFGVDRVLTVALQRSPDKIRITCSLINPRTHQQMDARTATGDANDLFALEDNTIADVFAMLPADVRSEQPTPSEVQAAGPAGYESYLKGRGYLLDYQNPENIDAAIQQFEQALKASPKYAPAYAGLGEANWYGYKADRGKDWLDKAKVNCEAALNAEPKLAEGHTCLGNVYRARGEYDNALREIKQAVALGPNDVLSVLALGDTYDKLHDYSASEAAFKQAIALNPNYWAAYNWMGAFYSSQARYADAEEMFQKVTEISPDNYRGYSNLGGVYLQEGRYQDAIDALQRSINLRPTTSAYSNLGTAYFYLRRYPEAIVAYDKARALDDQDYLNWGNLGDALYWSPNRRPESAAAYKRAIALGQSRLQINPKDATVLAFLADYYSMLGDKHAATGELEKALKLAPQDPDVLFRAALVYNQLGDQQQSLEWLKKAVAANFSRTTVRDTPDFDHLKSDPAFKAVLSGA